MADTNPSAPHALYRFYGDAGQLLYVGITASPSGRFKQHGDTKNWWPEVRGISVEWYEDRDTVLAAEARAIAVENPKYNIRRPTIGRHTTQVSHERVSSRITWTCAHCETPVRDGKGYIALNAREEYEVERAMNLWNAANPGPVIEGPALMTYPEPAEWKVTHLACDPEPDGELYAIGVERARTHAQLLSWTAHLMGKNWLRHTDWNDLIKAAARVDA